MKGSHICFAAIVVASALTSPAMGQNNPLPNDIPRGTIAVRLDPVATGMAAPLYGISPPGDTSRLFVLEQNGLVRLLQNGVLQPGAALDLGPRVQQAPVGNGPLNPGNRQRRARATGLGVSSRL